MHRRQFLSILMFSPLLTRVSWAAPRGIELESLGPDFDTSRFLIRCPDLVGKGPFLVNSRLRLGTLTWYFIGAEAHLDEKGEWSFLGKDLGMCISGMHWTNPAIDEDTAIELQISFFKAKKRYGKFVFKQ